MPTEALILRRIHPVPVTFSDLRAAHDDSNCYEWVMADDPHTVFSATLKRNTGALDEVYAVIDGHEVRIGLASSDGGVEVLAGPQHIVEGIADLMIKADEQGYWERPHEVVHVLEERPISRRVVNLACGVSVDKVRA